MSNDRRAERQALWNGFGNGMSQAFELAAIPGLFALLGWWIDGKVGSGPWVMVGLLAFGIVATFLRTYYAYAAQMAEHEKDKPWKRSRP
jgi:F0F1-type ATP synthase assembly protein I